MTEVTQNGWKVGAILITIVVEEMGNFTCIGTRLKYCNRLALILNLESQRLKLKVSCSLEFVISI